MLVIIAGLLLFAIGNSQVRAIGTLLIGIGLLWLAISWAIHAAKRTAGGPQPKFSAVLFDLDGTLTDPQEGICRCLHYALEALGRELPPAVELRWCIGPPLRSNFAQILKTDDPALLDKAVALYRERFGETGMYENALFPEAEEALEIIRELNLKLFIASSKPLVYVEKILAHFNISGYFDGVYGSELNGDRTIKADLIKHLLEKESLDPATTLMVGDREQDILGARACGVRCAAVTYGYGDRKELDAAKPDYIFDSLLDVAKFLEALR